MKFPLDIPIAESLLQFRKSNHWTENYQVCFDAMRRLAANRNCCDKTLYDPGHFTASVFVYDETSDSLLLLLHKKLQIWVQPGGHIDPGEQPGISALRELKEETSIDAEKISGKITSFHLFDLDIHGIPKYNAIPAHKHFDLRYLLRLSSKVPIEKNLESTELQWVERKEIGKFNNDSDMLRVAQAIH